MDEALSDALAAAGGVLAEAVGAGLAGAGLPGALTLRVEGGRVVIATRAAEVVAREFGRVGQPPAPVLQASARAALDDARAVLAQRLGGRGR